MAENSAGNSVRNSANKVGTKFTWSCGGHFTEQLSANSGRLIRFIAKRYQRRVRSIHFHQLKDMEHIKPVIITLRFT